MPDTMFWLATAWIVALLAGTVVVLVRAPSPFWRILAVDTAVLLVVAFLLVLAIGEDAPVFVDAALVLALLGFTTTVALVRVERQEASEG